MINLSTFKHGAEFGGNERMGIILTVDLTAFQNLKESVKNLLLLRKYKDLAAK